LASLAPTVGVSNGAIAVASSFRRSIANGGCDVRPCIVCGVSPAVEVTETEAVGPPSLGVPFTEEDPPSFLSPPLVVAFSPLSALAMTRNPTRDANVSIASFLRRFVVDAKCVGVVNGRQRERTGMLARTRATRGRRVDEVREPCVDRHDGARIGAVAGVARIVRRRRACV